MGGAAHDQLVIGKTGTRAVSPESRHLLSDLARFESRSSRWGETRRSRV
jgi:hypothetical protein